jgi:hypothetical protein
MSTSTKSPGTIRQGGPGASHENAKAPLRADKPGPADRHDKHIDVSGGGGEADSHHTHQAAMKGGKAPRQD